jgi:hypothetical protein
LSQSITANRPYAGTTECSRFNSTLRVRDFTVLITSRLALGRTLLSVQWLPKVVSRWVKGHGLEADHSRPSSAQIKNAGAIPPLLHVSLLYDAYLNKYRDNLSCRNSFIFIKLQHFGNLNIYA